MTPDNPSFSLLTNLRSFVHRHVPTGKMLAAICALGVIVACQDALMPTEPITAPALRFDGAASGALIMTDKADYAPGDTVKITGSGWQPGETVKLVLDESDGDTTRVWSVVATDSGTFVDATISPQPHDLNVTFTLNATGLISERTAQATFTDGNIKVQTSAAGITMNLPWSIFNGGVCAGSATSTGTEPNIGFSGGAQWNKGVGNTESIRLVAPAFSNQGGAFSGWTSSAPFVPAYTSPATSICITGAFSASHDIIANYGIAVATTLTLAAPSPSSVTYGTAGPVTLSATLTRTSTSAAVSGALVTFTVDGSSVGTATTNASGVATLATYNPSALNAGPHTVQATSTQQLISGTTYAAATSGTQTLTVTKANQVITFAALATKTFGDAPFTVSATGGASGNPVTFAATGNCTSSGANGSTITITGAGSCTVTASQAGNANYNAAADVPQAFTINKANQTITFAALGAKTYNDPDFSVSATASSGLAVSFAATGNCTIATATVHITGAGSCTITASQAGDANYNAATSVPQAFTINKATPNFTFSLATLPAQTFGNPDFSVFGGGATYVATNSTGGVTFALGTGSAGCTVTSVGLVHITGAATGSSFCIVTSSLASDANYLAAGPLTQSFNVAKATATITLSGLNQTYDATPRVVTFTTAPASLTVVSVTYDGSATAPTNAGSYAIHATLSNADYQADVASGTLVVAKAASTTSVTCPAGPYTYNGSAQTPCSASVSGVGGLSLTPTPTYSNNTNAGTATASYTFAGDANHDGSNAATNFTINKATSTTVVSCPATPQVYTGSAQTPCSVAVSGAGGLSATPTPTYTNNTNAGTANADYTFAGDANHDGSNGSATFTISKAASTTVVTCTLTTTVYTGVAQTPCSASVTGAGGLTGSPTVTYTDNVNVGTVTASAAFAGDANHEASNGAANFSITKATSATTVSCTGSPFAYTGAAQTPCTANVTGAGGLSTSGTPTYSDNTNAGTATASFTYAGDANHEGSNGSTTFTIIKASSTTTVNCPAGPYTYTGSAQTPCSANVSGAGGLNTAVTPSYSDNTNAGTATASYVYTGDANHEGSNGNAGFSIGKATSTTVVSCTAGPFTYTGSAQTPCSVAVTGAGSLNDTPAPSYSNNTNAGTASASYTFAGDANHDGSNGSANFTIAKANATITVNGYNDTYDGAAHGATGTAKGVSSETLTGLDLGATFTTVPGGTANWTFTDATGNYNNANGAAAIVINKKSASVSPAANSKEYGEADPALTGTTSGFVGGDGVTASYSRAPGENVGTYAISATLSPVGVLGNYDITYNTADLTITKATLTITGPTTNREYGDANPSLAGTFSGQKFSETFTVSGTTTAIATSAIGDYDIVPSVTGGTLGNYNVTPVNGKLTITKATLSITGPTTNRIYGDANPDLSGTFSGQKNSETFTVSGTTSATATSPIGDYDIVPSATGTTLTNYNVTPINGKLTVKKAALTITGPTTSREYGDANPDLSGTFSGQKNGESFTISGSTTANATSAIGDYDIVPSASGATLTNYDVTPVNGKLTITKATLTITGPTTNRIYGDANPDLSGAFSGQKNSETFTVAGTTTATATTAIGDYDIVPSASGATLTNYNVTPVNGKLTIKKAALTITGPTLSREYGDANPDLAGTFSGQKNGESFTISGTTTATATSAIGDYDIVPSASGSTLGNYDVTPVNGKLTITKATLTITGPTTNRIYGDANPDLSGTFSGQKNSETFTVSGSTSATATSSIGDYDIVPSASGSTLGNYDVTPVNGKLTITKATLTITGPTTNRIYGDANPDLSGTFSGQKNSETFTVAGTTTATATTAIGDYDIVPSATGTTLTNYNVTPVNGKLTIKKAALTITGPTTSREYGDANPDLSGTFSGQKNGESFTISGTTTATATSAIGDYDIVPSASGGSTLGNYDVTPVNGKLTITKATLTITGPTTNRIYGDANPDLSGTFSGQKNSETFTVNGSTSATATSSIGDYDIVPSATGTTLTNYNVTPINGKLTIKKAALTITGPTTSREYGDANPDLSGTFSGQKNGESFTISGSTTANATTSIGDYDIVPSASGATLGNYDVTPVNGKLTITKATLTITGPTLDRIYGDANPDLSGTFSGQKNSETFTIGGSTSAVATSPIGDYDIIPAASGATLTNYNVSPVNGKLTIKKATLTITGPTLDRIYGDANPDLSGTFSGQKNAETFTISGTTTAGETSPIGDYDIVPSAAGGTLTNYNVTPVNGKLTIKKAALTITGPTLSREYGDANPDLSGTFSGQKNGESFTISGSTTATQTTAIGDYDIVPSASGATLTNYNVTPVNGKLTITKATLTITGPTTNRIYGDANPDLSGTFSGQKNSETFTITGSTSAVATSPIGDYDIVPSAAGTTLTNYNVTPVNGKLTVKKAALTITGPTLNREYGEANPDLAGTFSGQKNGETFTIAGTTSAVATSSIGDYDIVPSVSAGSTITNYDVTPVNGKLTVTKATLTITGPTLNREYGEPNPGLGGTFSGQKNSETFTVTGSTAAVATSTVAGGPYAIVPAVTGGTLTNYNVTPVNGSLAITKATLTITGPTLNREYGEPNPGLGGTFSGQKNSETFTVTGSTAAVATSTVAGGPYAITPAVTGAMLDNYNVTPVNGALSITKATLTITGPTLNRIYGDANPDLAGTFSGQKNSEAFTIAGTTSAVATSAIGDYDVVPSVSVGSTIANYTVIPVNGKLTINKAALTITGPTLSREYGNANPDLGGTYSGQKNSETFTVTGSTGAVATSTVAGGPYAITPAVTGATLTNYNVTPVNGALTITKATLTITGPTLNRVYGDANPGLGGTYSGQKNSETFTVTGSTSAVPASTVAGGPYAITPAVTGATLDNYTVTPMSGALTITKAPLTITAANKSRTYAVANPLLTGTIVGIKNGDGITASYSTSATISSLVGTYPITPSAVDATPAKLGNYNVALVNGTLTIGNDAPVVTGLTGPSGPVGLGSPATVTGTFSDIGIATPQDPYTITSHWTSTGVTPFDKTGTVTSYNGSTGAFTITAPVGTPVGVYTITVTVTDRFNASSSGTPAASTVPGYTVVYDPSGGFVTGGGWINSPVGACKLANCTDNTVGKANFGFVSKYKQGSKVPDGNTEFQFQAGNLNFKGTSMDWLVVSGSRCQYHGTGTINGTGNYSFILTCIDGKINGGDGKDRFRMKIMDGNQGNGVVYDNQILSTDDAGLTTDGTLVSGGSITIHK